ncbi:hypothetical protein I3500192B8_09360 [Acidaminococcus intestini]|uniref:UPF0236 family transposase-like protein n=1 Tax=Acidaminococcus intestini TaxID=187327 RepID=UPI0036F3C9A4
MEKIVSDVIKIIKGSKNEIEMGKVLWAFLLNSIISMIALAFERIDDELFVSLKAEGYKVRRKDARTIQGIFGPLTYERRLVKKEGKRGKGFFVIFWGAKVSMHSWRGHALKTVRVLFRCVY